MVVLLRRPAALVLLVVSSAASSGCSGANEARAEPRLVRVEQPPASPEIRSDGRTKRAPSPAKLTSLYGLSLEIPAGWSEPAGIAFTSEVGPLRELAFIEEPLTPAEIEEWMADALRNGNDPSRGTSATSHRFENPELSILGVESRWTKGPAKQWTVYVSLETRAVLVNPDCSGDCDQVLATILRTLRPTREQPAPPEPTPVRGERFLLRAREFEFESPQKLENPGRFRFEADDRSAELSCSRSSAPDELDGPDWYEDFDLESEAQLAEFAVESLSSPVFQGQRWSATVGRPEGRRSLTYAEVSAQVGSFTFQCVFQREGSQRASVALLETIFSSARRD